jgi:hypothetical protein
MFFTAVHCLVRNVESSEENRSQEQGESAAAIKKEARPAKALPLTNDTL